MSAGMLGLIAMPFGLDGFFWWLMGVGIDWMIAVTEWVASLPGAIGRVTAFGTGPLILASLGIILLGLLRTPLRWSGAAVLALSTILACRTPQPDVLISGDGHVVGVRGRDGRLHLMKLGKDTFLVKEWLAADADARAAEDASLNNGVSCDDEGCVVQMADSAFAALTLKPDALGDDCERAALLVTARQVPSNCAAMFIDLERLRRQGAIALRRTRNGFGVEAVKPKGFDRPWAPAITSEGDVDSATLTLRPSAQHGVDATPSEADLQSED
jgi:competence protein ComEC